ncbi:NAD(P)-binding protein [Roridomyces roridus]|uniref:NAD(P)-binding protein n=1 Tax=Roridomyces roridus TaxID=1738132 RepID=A0AAD7BIS0_9AGAR|nr:NAD(P)-binding protein [Roridomyces roridus]
MSNKKNILITGATGHQGRALIRALSLSSSSPESESDFHILAPTRNPSSSHSTSLSKSHPTLVSLVRGDLDSPESIRLYSTMQCARTARAGYGACFACWRFRGSALMQMVRRGRASIEYGVSAFVFSSVERGGEYYDDHSVLDRRAKVNVERYIRVLGEKGLPWTILRPGFFMENYEGMIGAVAVGVLKYGLKLTTTNQLVAADDIGCVAAAVFKVNEFTAFRDREPARYASQILVISGEASTMTQQEEAYKNATGEPLPAIPRFLARILIAFNGHTKNLLADIERVHDTRETGKCPEVGVQTAAARQAHPGMMTLERWAAARRLAEGVEAQSTGGTRNNISVLRMLTGRQ